MIGKEGGPGSGPHKDGLSSTDNLKVGAHLTYNASDPKNHAGIKYEKPSTYPKPPGRLQMTNNEALLPFSSGQPHISTYPIGTGGVLQPKPSPTVEADAWHEMPKGWDSDSRDKYASSMSKEAKLAGSLKTKEGAVSNCMDKIDDYVSDPGAFCASLHDRVTGTTDWRGKGKESSHPLLGMLMPKMSKESDGGSAFPQALRAHDDES